VHVYVITNLLDVRRYVGKANTPLRRWTAHQTVARHRATTPLHLAMRELGAEAFRFEVVERCASETAALEAERCWIAALRSDEPERGYNLNSGGGGLTGCREETRRRMSAAKKGKASAPETVAKRAAGCRANGKKARVLSEVLALHAQGVDGAEIGRLVGRSRQRIYQLLAEAGVRGPGTGNISAKGRARQGAARSSDHWSQPENASALRVMVEMRASGATVREIGRAVGLTHGRVAALLRRLGNSNQYDQ